MMSCHSILDLFLVGKEFKFPLHPARGRLVGLGVETRMIRSGVHRGTGLLYNFDTSELR